MGFTKNQEMVSRDAVAMLETLAGEFRVVGVTGPRQSGKTTLVRSVFPDRAYANLEAPSLRGFALEDPK